MAKSGICARDMMITRVKTVTPGQVIDAVNMLLKHGFSGAPVLDENGALVGILSEKDCIQARCGLWWSNSSSGSACDDEGCHYSHSRHPHPHHRPYVYQQAHSSPARGRHGQLVGQISRRDLLKHAAAIFDQADSRSAAVLYLSAVDGSQPPG